ncbi:hypothetical protein E2C01_003660 [Portunus trituberculatus]|uniref:Uncharacterized protein n=1 Tax=Portunus trituberculatus TaxID=210409 RepID=A0A5B7CRT6_PORTR|nr:hypothetical protein [Portunus trituberculatus]
MKDREIQACLPQGLFSARRGSAWRVRPTVPRPHPDTIPARQYGEYIFCLDQDSKLHESVKANPASSSPTQKRWMARA